MIIARYNESRHLFSTKVISYLFNLIIHLIFSFIVTIYSLWYNISNGGDEMVATISDVAKRAGVSISTVSKVLKNYANISDGTKEKVIIAVKELNYIPNSIASALSSKKYEKVALYIYINDLKQSIDEMNMSK